MAKLSHSRSPQTFSITAPAALRVQLVGTFTHWQTQAISMQKGTDGVWRTTVDLPPGEHHYRFIVDGEWRDDPNCTLWVDNTYGSRDAVRRVS